MWNESEFAGFAWFHVRPEKIWTPDIYLTNEYVISLVPALISLTDDN